MFRWRAHASLSPTGSTTTFIRRRPSIWSRCREDKPKTIEILRKLNLFTMAKGFDFFGTHVQSQVNIMNFPAILPKRREYRRKIMAKLFEKSKVAGIVLKNRVGMGPMGFGHTDADGAYSDRQIEYYVERAKGGYGLIYPTATKVCSVFEPSPFPNILQDAHHATKLSMICEKVHQYGGKVCSQLSIGSGKSRHPLQGHHAQIIQPHPIFWNGNHL